MAPKRSDDSKGKAAAQAGTSAAAARGTSAAVARGASLTAAMPVTRAAGEAIAKVRHLVAAGSNEHGVTELRPSGSRLAEGYYPIFIHTLYAGLVPPFSEFLLAILEVYQIQLLHLHPNSILILAIFAYFCEAYVGIRPSVALFRSFYSLRNTARGERLGCASFRIAAARNETYIPIAWNGEEAVTMVTKKVDNFRTRWLFVEIGSAHV